MNRFTFAPKRTGTLALGLILGLALVIAPRALHAQDFDLLIRNGRVLDGSGSPAFRADIGINGDQIVALGRLDEATARRVVEAGGLYVAPGFIDLHSHADRALASDDVERRKAYNLVAQGITTIVVGPDGRNAAWPVAEEIAAYRTLGTALNVVPMVGHATVRGRVMGDDYERPATADEIEQMAVLVREGMEAGAWGLGAGLEYRPGRFSATEEVIELARVVADYDGFYYVHQRSQSPLPLWQTPSIVDGWRLDGTDGMKETIRIGRETGIRVVGSHIKAKGPTTWGHSAIDVLLIEQARREGVQVYLDQYPYETFGGGPTDVIPIWAYAPPGTDHSDGLDDPDLRAPGLLDNFRDNLRQNLDDPAIRPVLLEDITYLIDLKGGADRLVIVVAPTDTTLVGQTLAEAAKAHGKMPEEMLIHFALTGDESIRSGVLFRPIAGHAFDVETYMRQEYTATSTDAGVAMTVRPGLHPRYYGAFPRKIAYYVKEKGVISLPFAIRSGTGLAAQIIGLTDRGYVREGYKADLVIFDLDRLQDRATILDPGRYPEGIAYVLVNGGFTVDDGERTGALPGVVITQGDDAATAEAALARFAVQIERDVRADGIGSITAAVVRGDRVVWTRAFGWADRDQQIPATPETIYRTGSISKSVTAVLLAQLVEDGTVSLDDPVAQYFPEINQLADPPDGALPITFRHLVSHTAGLIREPNLPGAAAGPIATWEAKILASIPTTSFQTPPGTEYSYSNIGFGLLGLALSRAAGQPFMDLVHQRIFEPLGMTSSTFILTPEMEQRMSVGYLNWGDSIDAAIPALEHAGRGYKVPNGGVYATAGDLARFIAGQTGAAPTAILSPASRAEMQRIQTPGDQTRGYGLGFSVRQAEGGPWIVGHGGSVAGYTAYLCFDPETQIGVVLLRNYNRGQTSLGRTASALLVDLVKTQQR